MAYSNYDSGNQEFATVRLMDTNTSNPSLHDSAAFATILPPPKEPGPEWMEGSAARLTKQQAVIRSQGAKIAELEQELKATRRPKKAESRMAEMQQRVDELQQLAAVQAREMNTEFSKLVAAMNELDKAKGKYSSRTGQADLPSTASYRDSVLRQHARQRTEVEVMEAKIANLAKELSDLEDKAETTRLRNIQEEQEGNRRITRTNVDITAKESELRNLQFQLKSAKTDLDWSLNSKDTSEEKIARLQREYRQQEMEQHVQYLEIINKISELQVEVEEAEKRLVEADRDLESESRKMRVAFENHTIMSNILKPAPVMRGPQPLPPEPPEPTEREAEGLSFDARGQPPWWTQPAPADMTGLGDC